MLARKVHQSVSKNQRQEKIIIRLEELYDAKPVNLGAPFIFLQHDTHRLLPSAQRTTRVDAYVKHGDQQVNQIFMFKYSLIMTNVSARRR